MRTRHGLLYASGLLFRKFELAFNIDLSRWGSDLVRIEIEIRRAYCSSSAQKLSLFLACLPPHFSPDLNELIELIQFVDRRQIVTIRELKMWLVNEQDRVVNDASSSDFFNFFQLIHFFYWETDRQGSFLFVAPSSSVLLSHCSLIVASFSSWLPPPHRPILFAAPSFSSILFCYSCLLVAPFSSSLIPPHYFLLPCTFLLTPSSFLLQ